MFGLNKKLKQKNQNDKKNVKKDAPTQAVKKPAAIPDLICKVNFLKEFLLEV